MPSFYRPKGPPGAHDANAWYGPNGKADAQAAEPTPDAEQSVWAGRRKAQPANVLLPGTRRWLESLPVASRPLTLAAQFPRLANLIALNWDNPRDCAGFIYSLLNDHRGGRRGFPREVMEDILRLRVCYANLHPIVDWEASALWRPSGPKR